MLSLAIACLLICLVSLTMAPVQNVSSSNDGETDENNETVNLIGCSDGSNNKLDCNYCKDFATCKCNEASKAMHSLKSEKTIVEENKTNEKCKHVVDFLSLLKNVRLLLYGSACTLTVLSTYIVYAFLPDMMVHDHEFSKMDAGYIIPVVGAGSFIGSILTGALANHVKNSELCISFGCQLSLGILCLSMPYCSQFSTFAFVGFFMDFHTVPFAACSWNV